MKIFLLLLTFSIIFIAGCLCESEWNCSIWSECVNGTQTRICIEKCNQTENIENQTCCLESWSCGEWSQCSAEGIETRTCTDANSCGTIVSKPVESQSCTPLQCYQDTDCVYNYVDCRKECGLLGYGGPTGEMYCQDNECYCHCADEICNNDIDDDLDGFTDCDDFDCVDVCEPCESMTRAGPIPCSYGYCDTGNCTYSYNTSVCECV